MASASNQSFEKNRQYFKDNVFLVNHHTYQIVEFQFGAIALPIFGAALMQLNGFRPPNHPN